MMYCVVLRDGEVRSRDPSAVVPITVVGKGRCQFNAQFHKGVSFSFILQLPGTSSHHNNLHIPPSIPSSRTSLATAPPPTGTRA